MRKWAGFDHESDLGSIELSFGVIFGVPVDLDRGEVLDGIVICSFRKVFDRWFV